jgi:hypothetical protein
VFPNYEDVTATFPPANQAEEILGVENSHAFENSGTFP